MRGKIFIDTNILVYAYTNGDIEKNNTAILLLQNPENSFLISTQVLSELYSALSKYKIEHDVITSVIKEITTFCDVVPVDIETVNLALIIKKKYAYSYWDSLILSAALENECQSLYSEDMQDGQTVENTFEIINIFKKD